MTEGTGRYRIGFDIGGTFTDFIPARSGQGRDQPAQMPDHAARPVGRARSRVLAELVGAAGNHARPRSATSCTARPW